MNKHITKKIIQYDMKDLRQDSLGITYVVHTCRFHPKLVVKQKKRLEKRKLHSEILKKNFTSP